MTTYSDRVISIGQDIKQISRRHEVETWEGQTFCLEVLSQSLLTECQVTLDCLQFLIEVWLVGGIHNVGGLLNLAYQFLEDKGGEK